MHSLVCEAVPACALRAFAVPLEIQLAVIGGGVERAATGGGEGPDSLRGQRVGERVNVAVHGLSM